MRQKLIIGCGYLGLRVAQRWLAQGDTVFALTRSPQRAVELADLGLQPVVGDVTRPESLRPLAELPPLSTVVYAVGYDRTATASISEVYAGGLQNVLNLLNATLLNETVERLIYISTTGVYSGSDDRWTAEDAPAEPTRPGGIASLTAERLLQQHALAPRSVILRLAGIYGPNRIPRTAAIAAGEPIAAPIQGYLNLIHVDDAADIVLASEGLTAPLPLVLNVSDGHPALRFDYYNELARLLGAPAPCFVPADPASPAAQRAEASKRIDNRRLLELIGPTLRYPSYREGLAAILNSTAL